MSKVALEMSIPMVSSVIFVISYAWSMQSRMTTDLALPALLSAVWRRKPKTKVMIHSDSHIMATSSRVV
jgi:transposase InsO family protein